MKVAFYPRLLADVDGAMPDVGNKAPTRSMLAPQRRSVAASATFGSLDCVAAGQINLAVHLLDGGFSETNRESCSAALGRLAPVDFAISMPVSRH
jgi:hypothetical protein